MMDIEFVTKDAAHDNVEKDVAILGRDVRGCAADVIAVGVQNGEHLGKKRLESMHFKSSRFCGKKSGRRYDFLHRDAVANKQGNVLVEIGDLTKQLSDAAALGSKSAVELLHLEPSLQQLAFKVRRSLL